MFSSISELAELYGGEDRRKKKTKTKPDWNDALTFLFYFILIFFISMQVYHL